MLSFQIILVQSYFLVLNYCMFKALHECSSSILQGLLVGVVSLAGYNNTDDAILDVITIYGLATPLSDVALNGDSVNSTWINSTKVQTLEHSMENLLH